MTLPTPPSTRSALEIWRESTLSLIMRASLVLVLPVFVVDLIGAFSRGQVGPALVSIACFGGVFGLSFARRAPYLVRVSVGVLSLYALGAYLLLNVGLVGSGRVHIFAAMVFAALLLDLPLAGVAWGLGVLIIAATLGSQAGGLLPVPAGLAARVADPNTLLTNGLIVICMGTAIFFAIRSLVRQLSISLRAAEQTNATLEQRVAERTAALRQALEENRYLTAAVNAMPLGMVITRMGADQHTISFVNPAFTTITGYTAEEAIGRSPRFLQVSGPDDAGIQDLHDALRDRRSATVLLQNARKDITPYWNEMTVSPVFDDLGAFVGYVGIQMDVTARTQAEQHLRTIERQLQLILRTIPDELWFKDRAGRYLLVSEALAAASGRSSAAMVGRRAEELFEPELAALIDANDRQVIEQGQSYVGEWQLVDREGGERWFDGSRTPIVDDDGTIIGQLGIARDINQRKHAEATMAQQLRYAEALARCSRALLASGRSTDAYRGTLEQALAILMSAVEADRIAVYRYHRGQDGAPAGPRTFQLVAAVNAPGLPPQRPPAPEEVADIIQDLSELMGIGGCFNGPVSGRFPHRPAFQRYSDANEIKSVILQPLMIESAWWGYISVNDHTRLRSWDDPALQFVRTAAEMIVSFIQGWEAAQALHEREALLREVGRMTQIGGWELDLVSDTLSWSEEVYAIHEVELPPHTDQAGTPAFFRVDPELRRSRGEAVSAHMPEDRATFLATVRACMSEGTPWDLELPFVTAKGRHRWVRSQGQAVATGGRITRMRGTFQDITARKESELSLLRAKDAAESADRAKSAFLAMMSHEIRTPLNAVIGMTSLLLESDLSTQQREYAATIRISGSALLALINDILDLSRIEAGQVALEEQPFSPAESLQETISLVAHQADAKGLPLYGRIAQGLPALIYGDETRLRQIVTNLLSNAVKFTQRGEIVIDAQPREEEGGGQSMIITVRDTGIGITPDQLEHIFRPFVQADSSTTRRYGGSGLGLAISHQLAELMGGTLTVVSTQGVGSSFTITLPLRVADARPEAQRRGQLNRLGDRSRPPGLPPADSYVALRMLVAEDNPINQMVTLRLLERLGCRADIVTNGREAVEAATHQPYDIILMDVQMPDMDGEQAAGNIRAYGDAIHQPYIIALTAHAMAGDRERALAAGMNAYLSKPIQIGDLRAALSLAIGQPLS